jgi:hypothetical protein
MKWINGSAAASKAPDPRGRLASRVRPVEGAAGARHQDAFPDREFTSSIHQPEWETMRI